MKKIIKKTIIAILLASTFTGCAKNGITVSDIALSPVYAVMTVGYVATKATTIVVGGAIAATGAAVNSVSNSNKTSDATIVAKKD
jgi:hypothetical protein